MPGQPYRGHQRDAHDHHKPKRRDHEHGKVYLISSDGLRVKGSARMLAAGSPQFKAWIRQSAEGRTPSFNFDDPVIERAEVLTASIAIIQRDQTIIDVPYQCQIDAIRFLTKYQFVHDLRYIKTSIHLTLAKHTYPPAFHPFAVFRLAVQLNDIDLCGRIIAEMGGMRISSNRWGKEIFGEPIPGAGVFSAGAMSLQDMQSLPPAVYWALGRAEVMCGSANYQGIAMEFMRLMKLQGSPALMWI